MSVAPVLIAGNWIASQGSKTFQAVNPITREPLPETYPVSPWNEIEQAIQAAAHAYEALKHFSREQIASFLESYANRIETRKADLVRQAHLETALPAEGRLGNVELPRTINQLRLAAKAARTASWTQPTIDTRLNIRSCFGSIGPVVVFGPNNFPFAFNGAAGGDFAAAIAAGNPVIAKGHPSHPGTTRIFAEEAHAAVQEAGLPTGTVQLIYRTEHADGAKLVSHPLMGATGYTGGRSTGLALKTAADHAGKPIYLELSSINPIVILPGALKERGDKVSEEFATSCLMGVGQFCTNPGMIFLVAGPETDQFLKQTAQRFEAAPVGTLLSGATLEGLSRGVSTLLSSGAKLLVGGQPGGGQGFCYNNTLLSVSGATFLAHAEQLQTEAFGNASLCVVADNLDQLQACLAHLEGNLTGGIYSSTTGEDDAAYSQVEPLLRQRVGRLLNDKMPTGVAVSPAMNHGGPFPATGHPGFTAVGLPAAIRRFAMLQCYDNVREARLPEILRNAAVEGVWRFVDETWTIAGVGE